MPMRTPVSWSEALLNAAPKPPGNVAEGITAQATTQAPLVPRNMHDSYSELILPFGSSSQLVEEYINASGGIRTGKSVESLPPLVRCLTLFFQVNGAFGFIGWLNLLQTYVGPWGGDSRAYTGARLLYRHRVCRQVQKNYVSLPPRDLTQRDVTDSTC
jgi:hypothetical protein